MPHYKFDTPDKFKRELDKINDRQKQVIRADQARCFLWTMSAAVGT
jgi:hypothetical protein